MLGEFKHPRGKIYSEGSMHNGCNSKSSGEFIRILLTLENKIFQSKIIQLNWTIEITIFASCTLHLAEYIVRGVAMNYFLDCLQNFICDILSTGNH